MSKLVPYLGGKRLLTKTILALLPEHNLYCEPFGGSGTILLEKAPSPAEVFNDVNGEMVNLFRVALAALFFSVVGYHTMVMQSQFQVFS